MHNGWFKWVWYTVKDMTFKNVLVCADNTSNSYHEKHTFVLVKDVPECDRRNVGKEDLCHHKGPSVLSLPMCGIQCRLIYGSQMTHHLLSVLPTRTSNVCTEFQPTTT